MKVETGLMEVDEAVEKHVGTRNYEDRREAYGSAMREVASVGGESLVDNLVRWLSGEVREKKRLPSEPEVNRAAARICREYRVEIPDGSPLADV
jgi:hypothetical protein